MGKADPLSLILTDVVSVDMVFKDKDGRPLAVGEMRSEPKGWGGPGRIQFHIETDFEYGISSFAVQGGQMNITIAKEPNNGTG